MQAIEIAQHGGPDVLTYVTREDPLCGPDDVLIDVLAIGVNFTDLHQRAGNYHYGEVAAFIPGSEGAGRVLQVGEKVEGIREGDDVAFWSPGCGAYAERVSVRADRTVPLPIGMAPEVAVALMVQGLTAHYLATSTHVIQLV